jgi:carbon monoxide dehydrogenase subunit G
MMSIAALTLAGLAAAAPQSDVAHVEKAITIARDPAAVWDAVRDVYHVDTRLVPGLVTRVTRDGEVRTVTFADGYTVNERILSVDEAKRSVTYAAFGGRSTYHRAAMIVTATADGQTRLTWWTDVSPATLVPFIERNMDAGLATMKRHLEAAAR